MRLLMNGNYAFAFPRQLPPISWLLSHCNNPHELVLEDGKSTNHQKKSSHDLIRVVKNDPLEPLSPRLPPYSIIKSQSAFFWQTHLQLSLCSILWNRKIFSKSFHSRTSMIGTEFDYL